VVELELPKPPWYHRIWVWGCILTVMLVVVTAGAVAGLRQLQPSAGPTTVTAPRPEPTKPDVTELTRPATSQPRTGVLWQKTGRDIHYGTPFRAPARWRIVWSFDCRNFASHGGGNFKITGEGDFGAVSVEEFAVRASGTEQMTAAGRGRLVVSSVCDRWTVRAVAS
jgi:hypothetical protein